MGSASGGSGSNPGASGGGSDPGNQPGYAGGGGNYGGNSFGGGLDSGSSLHPGPGGGSSVYGGNQGGRDYIAAHTALFGSAATQAAGIGSQGNATGFAGSVADFLSKPLASFANGLEGWAKTNDWSEFEKMAGLAPGAFSGFSENLQKSIDYIGQHDFSDPGGYAQPVAPTPKKTIIGYKSVPKTTYVTKAVTTKQPTVPAVAQLQGQLPTFAAMDALGLSTGITPDVIHTSYERVPTTTYERTPIYGSTTTKEIDAPGTIGQTISKATGLDSSGWGAGGGNYGSIGGSYDAGGLGDGGFHNSPQEGGYSGDGGFHGSPVGSGWSGDGGFHSTTPSIGEAIGTGAAPGSFTDPANGGSWGGTAGPGRGETAGGVQVSPSVQGPAPAATQGPAPGSYDFSNLNDAQATLAQGMQELFGPSIAQGAVSPASILASAGWGPRDEEYRSGPVTQPLAHPGQVNPNQGPESVGAVGSAGAQQTYDPLSSISATQALLATAINPGRGVMPGGPTIGGELQGPSRPEQGPEMAGNVGSIPAQQSYDPLSSLSAVQAALAGLGVFGGKDVYGDAVGPAEHPAWPATPSPSITNATALAHPGQDMSDWGGFERQGPLADRSLPGAGYDVADAITNAGGLPDAPGALTGDFGPALTVAQRALVGQGADFGADPWGYGAPVTDRPVYGYLSPLGGDLVVSGFDPSEAISALADFDPRFGIAPRPTGVTAEQSFGQFPVTAQQFLAMPDRFGAIDDVTQRRLADAGFGTIQSFDDFLDAYARGLLTEANKNDVVGSQAVGWNLANRASVPGSDFGFSGPASAIDALMAPNQYEGVSITNPNLAANLAIPVGATSYEIARQAAIDALYGNIEDPTLGFLDYRATKVGKKDNPDYTKRVAAGVPGVVVGGNFYFSGSPTSREITESLRQRLAPIAAPAPGLLD